MITARIFIILVKRETSLVDVSGATRLEKLSKNNSPRLLHHAKRYTFVVKFHRVVAYRGFRVKSKVRKVPVKQLKRDNSGVGPTGLLD